MKNKKLLVFGLFIFILMIGATLSVSYSFNKYGETVELHFYTNGGEKLDNVIFTHGKDTLLAKLPVPKKEGYVFKGWFIDETLETKLKSASMPEFNENSIVHLYAKWGVIEEKDKLIHPYLWVILCLICLILIVTKELIKKIQEVKTVKEQI